jgi:serine/threonine protein kinase
MKAFDQEKLLLESDLCGGDYSNFQENYDIIGKIGKGGFGGVYKAYDKKNNCFVAVKKMP